jgi:hypothetical protein
MIKEAFWSAVEKRKWGKEISVIVVARKKLIPWVVKVF